MLLEATIGIRRSKAPNKQDDSIRVNDQITALRIRLIDGEGGQVGVITVADALTRAQSDGLDLVEVSLRRTRLFAG